MICLRHTEVKKPAGGKLVGTVDGEGASLKKANMDIEGDDSQQTCTHSSDNQKEIRIYSYNRAKKTWSKETIHKVTDQVITWNVTHAQL